LDMVIQVFDVPIYILSSVRTPLGRFNGVLSEFTAVDLGGFVIRAAWERPKIPPDEIQFVTMGNVVCAGLGMAPAKAAAIMGGLKESICARRVESVCASSLDALAITCDAIAAGAFDVAIAGGMESRTNAPYLLGPRMERKTKSYRKGERVKVKRAGAYTFMFSENELEQLQGTGLVDATAYDGLFWVLERKFMRQYAIEFAREMGYSVELVNEYASKSHEKARRAASEGWFDDEIVPCGEIKKDELPTDEQLSKMLEEAKDDIASGYNTATPVDGAAACLIASERAVEKFGVNPIARILGYARVECHPSRFLTAPVVAAKELIAVLREKNFKSEPTIIEANEAFGIQLPYFESAFVGMEINVHGGAIALGHPLGAAGARLLCTLLHAMRRWGHKYGLVALCFGGGGGMALAVELT